MVYWKVPCFVYYRFWDTLVSFHFYAQTELWRLEVARCEQLLCYHIKPLSYCQLNLKPSECCLVLYTHTSMFMAVSQENHCLHDVTIVMFSRTFYDAQSRGE